MRVAVLVVVLLAATAVVAAGGKPAANQKPKWIQFLGRKMHELEGTLGKIGAKLSALGKKVLVQVKDCVQKSPFKPALEHATACIVSNVQAHANSGDVGKIASSVLSCEVHDAQVTGALKTFGVCLLKKVGK